MVTWPSFWPRTLCLAWRFKTLLLLGDTWPLNDDRSISELWALILQNGQPPVIWLCSSSLSFTARSPKIPVILFSSLLSFYQSLTYSRLDNSLSLFLS